MIKQMDETGISERGDDDDQITLITKLHCAIIAAPTRFIEFIASGGPRAY